MFDAQLKENPEQYRAVQHIVAGSSKPAPYLVFGPPGTGTASARVLLLIRVEPFKQFMFDKAEIVLGVN